MASIFKELSYHSFSDIFSMGYSFVFTKLFYPKASLIRRPFHIRQKTHFQIGKGFTTGRNCRFEMYEGGKIIFGQDCHIGDNVHIAALKSVSIGDQCLFASRIFISDLSHGSYGQNGDNPNIPPNERLLSAKPVTIGNNVWLGENVCVLQGVSIGDCCIVGANATVTHDLPAKCIAVGSPAKPIKLYDETSNSWVKC